jgi:hypothetical protein
LAIDPDAPILYIEKKPESINKLLEKGGRSIVKIIQ